jgi:hypothetical protein
MIKIWRPDTGELLESSLWPALHNDVALDLDKLKLHVQASRDWYYVNYYT